jgi:uncharacterized membrane protein SpoIIM required for sporulation
MTEQAFLRRRESSWNELGEMLHKRQKLKNAAPSFVRLFREISQDLNTARAHGFDPAIIERLNMLVNEGCQILYGQQAWQPQKFALFILQTFPRSVRSQWRGILAALFLFYGFAFFFGFLCVRFPLMAGEIISERQLDQIEEMYNPESKHFLIPRNISSDADMFGYYIYNNISIAFRTFAGGIFAGIGSLLILCTNAVHLGVVAGHLINVGFSQTFFPFVIAHSAFELTAVVFSAHAGLLLGYRLFITRGLSRAASIKKAGQDALPIIAGSALMLVIAAIVEAFWSSRHQFPLPLRMGAGAGLWALLLLYFTFAGRKS